MSNVNIIPTSNRSATISKLFVISESSLTRKVVRAELVENTRDPEAGVSIDIVAQRKNVAGEWEDAPAFNLSRLRVGEEVRMQLRSGATKKLLEALEELRAIQKTCGVPWSEREVIVGDSESVFHVSDSRLAEALRNRLNSGSIEELTQILNEVSPDLLSQIAEARVLQERREAVTQFEQMMSEPHSEQDWQSFFALNQWIFGLGLCYHFLSNVGEQVPYRGAAYDRTGSERGDFLLATESESSRFTVLIEIKKPDTKLFENRNYRNGVALLSSELTGGVSQVQVNCRSWNIEGSRTELNRSLESDHNIFTCDPKGLLVIGHTDQFDTRDKRYTFELYRRNLHLPEILTFDEVLRRAKYIVQENGSSETPLESVTLGQEMSWDGDVPF